MHVQCIQCSKRLIAQEALVGTSIPRARCRNVIYLEGRRECAVIVGDQTSWVGDNVLLVHPHSVFIHKLSCDARGTRARLGV